MTRGYLLKTCDAEELLRAIDAVREGKVYVTADVTHVLIEGPHAHGLPSGNRTGTPPPYVLTPREREVLQLIAEGPANKEIGARLGAMKTIETHRSNVIRKLDLNSIAELTKCAVREGLTRPEQEADLRLLRLPLEPLGSGSRDVASHDMTP